MRHVFPGGFALACLLAAIAAHAEPAAEPAPSTEATADGGPEPQRLDPIVVTAPETRAPLTIRLDPTIPQQPLPAADGASFLRNIPGFNLIRKGGTDGDLVLRGLAGSRLTILSDGQELYGGCGMRMDPPTAYLYPETFDEVVIVKGPQTVRHGNGNLAGVVRFEHDAPQTGSAVRFSGVAGSFGRNDTAGSARWQNQTGGLRIDGSHAQMGDYADGDGQDVHSAYRRWNIRTSANWTPTADQRLTLGAERSDGEAAYADRAMDGVMFERDGLFLRYAIAQPFAHAEQAEAEVYRNAVDHVMDNYSLRTRAPGTMAMVSNPDRETWGLRASIDLAPSPSLAVTVGADHRADAHRVRSAMSMMGEPDYRSLPRTPDMDARISGLFAESTWTYASDRRLVGGLRYDHYVADNRLTSGDFAGDTHRDDLFSGFARVEADRGPYTAYAGIGHAQRPADYWERISYNAFDLQPERNSEIDLGVLREAGHWRGSLALFYSRIDDYILTRSDRTARNIDARRWGGEAELSRALGADWRVGTALSWVHGENRSDGTALAQTPPLEGRLTLDWQRSAWAAGAVWRVADRQDRVQIGYGNIVGQDVGTTPGYGTLALHAGWRGLEGLSVILGVDNLLDRAYAEHLSRSAGAVPGYPVLTRVNEPGRQAWLRLGWQFAT
ncbi:TonB-dependent copper receptor [Fontimonas sp. SYSU GA230001]|uniref:TonB-dependent copper receptor n=1 Tax=Fontimonas sp. SYSU GA230001 TaxID=3142450 RepID=UPI0032B48CFD